MRKLHQIDWQFWGLLVTPFALIALFYVVLVYVMLADQSEWQAFAEKHSCKIVARVRGDTLSTVGFDAKGQVVMGVTQTPDKVGYLCDDGVTYYR